MRNPPSSNLKLHEIMRPNIADILDGIDLFQGLAYADL
jgi:hypothetical protein